MARRRGSFRAAVRQRRESLWLSIDPSSTTLAAASTAVVINLFNAAALALRPFTIVRTRGYWFVSSDQAAASENYGASLGYCVVSEQASAIGVTAIPTPETDRGSDLFFVHETLYGSFLFADATGFSDISGLTASYDSKAMRKVNEDEQMNVVLETPAIASSGVVLHAARMLIKLH